MNAVHQYYENNELQCNGRPPYDAPMTLPELRQAARLVRRQPLFAAGVVAVIALAIGATTAIFSVVSAVLIRPLPLADPDRLITFTVVRPGTDRQPISLLDLRDFEEGTHTLTGIASYFGWSANMTGSGDAERLTGMRVSANYFSLTGAQVALGRAIQPDDEHRPVVVLSDGFWKRRFGAAADVPGQSIVLNGEAFTIVGVLRPDFPALVRDADVVVPYSPAADVRRANRAQAFLRVVARLAPGVTLPQAADDLTAVGARLRDAYPDSHGTDTAIRVVLLHEDVSGRSAPMLWTLLAAVALVMVVACANLANLFLVRSASRRRELALRGALGASRWRIAAQLLVETGIVGMAGGVLGLAVARAMVETLVALGPADLPRAAEIAVDARAALFAFVVSIGTSFVVGLAPALQAWHVGIRHALQDAERGASAGGARVRASLVFAEVALSMVLLMTAALLARSFERVQAVDPGFRAPQVLTVRLSLPRARYAGRAAIETFYDAVQPRVASLPGVRSVAAANVVPMNGYLATTAFYVDGVIAKDAPEAHYRMISPDYFRALGIPLRSGRTFTAADRHDSAAVTIVNETFARTYLPGRDPIGCRMRLDDGEKVPREVEIVGVVGDVRHFGLEKEATLEAYVPISQVPDQTTIWLANNMYWVVETAGPPLAVAAAVRREIAAVDPAVPASFVRSMDQWLGNTLAARRFNLQLVAAFAAAALLLAVIGVYAVSAAAVAARTREIGIRAALGATRRQVMTLVLTSGLSPVLAGLAVGTLAALFSGAALSGLLFGVPPWDPVSLAIGAATLAAAALGANLVPAMRAARVDPIEALRVE
jgi:putative ABC transport system permease protein